MLKEVVLVIGSGGKSKFGFLEELVKLNKNVIVIDGEDRCDEKYPDKVKTIFLPSLNKKNIINEVKSLTKSYKITSVGTILEPCMETAAYVRDYLGLPGYSYDKILWARNKARIYDLVSSAGLNAPKFEVFNKNDSKEKILSLTKDFITPFILKPTMGAANVGLRCIRSHNDFWRCYNEALKDTNNEYDNIHSFKDVSNEWLICEYISGREIEAHLYLEEGNISFFLTKEKPLTFERGEIIEENNAVTPPVTLTDKDKKYFEQTINKFAKVVYEKIVKPCSVKYWTFFGEFKLNDNGEFCCLEYTLRIGGAIDPYSILRSSGVNMFEIAARAQVGLKTEIPSKLLNNGVCYQVIFSDRSGIFKGFSGLDNLDEFEFFPLKKIGTMIEIPHSDYLAFILAKAKTPQEASNKIATTLKKARVLVETKDGVINEVKIPTMPIM